MDFYVFVVLYLCLILVWGTVLFMSFLLAVSTLFSVFSLLFYYIVIIDNQRLIVPNLVLETPAIY
jgi:hypothetical protein